MFNFIKYFLKHLHTNTKTQQHIKKWSLICIDLIIVFYLNCSHQWLFCVLYFVSMFTTTSWHAIQNLKCKDGCNSVYPMFWRNLCLFILFFIIRCVQLNQLNQCTIVFIIHDKYTLENPTCQWLILPVIQYMHIAPHSHSRLRIAPQGIAMIWAKKAHNRHNDTSHVGDSSITVLSMFS